MSSIIDILRSSSSEVLKAEAAGIEKWKDFRHTKKNLELFLEFHVAEVQFTKIDGSLGDIICTSNVPLIKLSSMLEESSQKRSKFSHMKPDGINVKDKWSVMTWDLVDNHYKTIKMIDWSIINFIAITRENILVLDSTMKSILKKAKK